MATGPRIAIDAGWRQRPWRSPGARRGAARFLAASVFGDEKEVVRSSEASQLGSKSRSPTARFLTKVKSRARRSGARGRHRWRRDHAVTEGRNDAALQGKHGARDGVWPAALRTMPGIDVALAALFRRSASRTRELIWATPRRCSDPFS